MTTAAKTSPVEIVQSLYTAFGRGDIPTIVQQLADNVEWRINLDPAVPAASTVPTFRTYRGKATIAGFFATLVQSLEMHSFQPVSFLAGDGEVGARIMIDATVRSTGRRLRLETLHHWMLEPSGKVLRFVDFQDTLAVAAAWDKVHAS
jgi:ketosteroid isomerase-like protein